MKEAYKTCGIRVGHRGAINGVFEESYYISAGWWILEYMADKMPKELKAAVIELTGELPEPGKQLVAVKDELPQYEFLSDALNAQRISEESETPYTVSLVIEDRSEKGLRYTYDKNGSVLVVREVLIDLLDNNSVDSDNGEDYPAGPFANEERNALVWRNNQSVFVACVYGTEVDTDIEYRKQLGKLLIGFNKRKG